MAAMMMGFKRNKNELVGRFEEREQKEADGNIDCRSHKRFYGAGVRQFIVRAGFTSGTVRTPAR